MGNVSWSREGAFEPYLFIDNPESPSQLMCTSTNFMES